MLSDSEGAAPDAPPPVEVLLERELNAAFERPDRRIAPERDLALRFGLTRAAVRRLLLQLEHEGRVVRHVGRGTFVLPPRNKNISGTAEGVHTSPAEIMQVRMLLEPQILKLTVANATAADIAEMRRCLKESESASSYSDFEGWDTRLHTLMAEASRNRLLERLYAAINDAREDPLWGNAKRRSFTARRRAEYEQDHRDLVDAIQDRDSSTAAAVMRRHLQRIESALIGPDMDEPGDAGATETS